MLDDIKAPLDMSLPNPVPNSEKETRWRRKQSPKLLGACALLFFVGYFLRPILLHKPSEELQQPVKEQNPILNSTLGVNTP